MNNEASQEDTGRFSEQLIGRLFVLCDISLNAMAINPSTIVYRCDVSDESTVDKNITVNNARTVKPVCNDHLYN